MNKNLVFDLFDALFVGGFTQDGNVVTYNFCQSNIISEFGEGYCSYTLKDGKLQGRYIAVYCESIFEAHCCFSYLKDETDWNPFNEDFDFISKDNGGATTILLIKI